ncbi:pilus assembly protein PilM [Thermodesulfobacteriota bacterium]
MAFLDSSDEISSTEKLLNLIRGKGTTPDGVADISSPKRKRKRPSSLRSIAVGKQISVGVDLGRDAIRMAKVQRISEKNYQLLDYAAYPVPANVSRKNPEFVPVLKTALEKFCKSPKQCLVWTSLSFIHMDMDHLRIPKGARKQLASTTYWALKKEIPFSDQEMMFDFEVQGEVVENGIQKTSVVAYVVRREEVDELRELFREAGFPLHGITTAPFCNQTLFRTSWVPLGPTETVATLFVGNDNSRIDLFCEGNLVLTRGIKTGMSSMVESLVEEYREKPDEITLEFVEDETPFLGLDEDRGASLTKEQARKILKSVMGQPSALNEDDPGHELSPDVVFDFILPAVERLVRQIERTLEHYTVTLGNERVDRLLISGMVNDYPPLAGYIAEQIGLQVDVIDPLDPSVPFLGDVSPPSTLAERAPYGLALSLALCENSHTPNLLFTYGDRESARKVPLINRAILAGFVTIMLSGFVYYQWQVHHIGQKKEVISHVKSELEELGPVLDENSILIATARLSGQQRKTRESSERYLGLAIVAELSELTPKNIRLLSLSAQMGGGGGPNRGGDEAQGRGEQPDSGGDRFRGAF